LKKKIREYLGNFKNILKLIILSNLLFLVIYKIYLHSFLFHIISGKEDIVDIEYYTAIFNNLEYAIIIVTILIFLILISYKRLKIIFNQSNRKILFICIGSTIVIQLTLLFILTPEPISDSKHHIDNANLLYETGTYVNSAGNPTAFWTVGLPAYLVFLKSFCKDFILTAKLINILLSIGLIISCYFVFKNYLTPRALNVFLIIFTFFPNNLFSSNIILTDYPFAFFLWASIMIMFVIRNKPSIWLSVLMGVFCALASYLRPIGITLTFIFTAILFLKNYSNGRINSLIMLTVFLSIMLPWGIRNFNVFHSIVPVSTNGGYIFLMGNHKNSSGGVNFNFEYNFMNPNEADESRKAYSRTFRDILNNSMQSLIRLPKKILHTYYRGDSSITWGFKKTEENLPALLKSIIFYLTNLMFYIIILLNIYIILLRRKEINFKKYTELIVLSIYILLIIIVFVGSERYHIPLFPIHIFLVAKYFEA